MDVTVRAGRFGQSMDVSGGPGHASPDGEADRPHRARCNVCGAVIESRHEWDVAGCACGRLCLSGGRRWRRVNWQADPGASWTDLSDGGAGQEGSPPEEPAP